MKGGKPKHISVASLASPSGVKNAIDETIENIIYTEFTAS